jgi:hypothetical protein
MSIEGDLNELPLASLIEMTALGSKTAHVLLYDAEGAEAGRLVFRDGRLVGATCGTLGPEKSFYAMLAVKEGRFRFEPTVEIGDEQCNLPTASLLMEGMRRIDELTELRRKFPAPAYAYLAEGQARDPLEARVLGYLGPGARTIGDIVDGILVGADADEYDALKTITRLEARGVIRIQHPRDGRGGGSGGPPQPELER